MFARFVAVLLCLPAFVVPAASVAAEAAEWGAIEVAGNTIEPGQKGGFQVIAEQGFEASA